MADKYILGIDQSTQGTKALLFDEKGELVKKAALSHKQIINEIGWVEHDLLEILHNVREVTGEIVNTTPFAAERIVAIGLSNQRETVAAWDRLTGKPVCHAIVWQCPRGQEICERIKKQGAAGMIRKKTGLTLSPYFSASKMSWIIENNAEARKLLADDRLCIGTIDSWLVYCLTDQKFATDYSNASRTQLFNIKTLEWDQEILNLFQIPVNVLPTVCSSNAEYGLTDMGGILSKSVPIHGVIGDSQGALFAQGCHQTGMAKATYGTGSSIMLNIGETPIFSNKGIVTSLAWGLDGKVQYVLEGNINNAGSVITWLKEDLGLIASAEESEKLARNAREEDQSYLVPAFTGLGAPYWASDATGLFTGITRIIGRNEMVRAALDCIAYQVADIIFLMEEETKEALQELKADGGATKNAYLMQFQSDVTGILVTIQKAAELSGMGAAYLAGLAVGIYDRKSLFLDKREVTYVPQMKEEKRKRKLDGWKDAVLRTLYR